jgi:hypothetical protein
MKRGDQIPSFEEKTAPGAFAPGAAVWCGVFKHLNV